MEYDRNEIVKELRKAVNGFTISELAKKLNVSRQTVANCFAFLEGAEKVRKRQAGMAKIYYWTKERKMKRGKVTC